MITNFYIDGFNLYYGSLKGTPHKWLNLVEFCRASFPPPKNVIGRVKYYTARVVPYPSDPQQPARQNAYLRALSTLPEIDIHFGKYQLRRKHLRAAFPPEGWPVTEEVMVSEEKGSDVNLASHLLLDGFKNVYEAAVVVSNDTDLAEPIRIAHRELGKKVVVLMPCKPGSLGNVDLRKAASHHATLDPAILAASQFPKSLLDARGRTIRKPDSW